MNQDQAQAAVLWLGQQMGLPTLTLDAQGSCQLVFDQRWVVTLLHDGAADALGLHCPLGEPGQAPRLPSRVLCQLLSANFMGQCTGGMHITLAPDQRLYLHASWPLTQAHTALHQRLELVLNEAERWAGVLTQSLDPPSEEQTHMPAHKNVAAWALSNKV